MRLGTVHDGGQTNNDKRAYQERITKAMK